MAVASGSVHRLFPTRSPCDFKRRMPGITARRTNNNKQHRRVPCSPPSPLDSTAMADLPTLLQASLNPQSRKEAELRLFDLSLQPGFLSHLLRFILQPPQDRAIRLAGAVYLKNVAKLRWEEVRSDPFLSCLSTAFSFRMSNPSWRKTKAHSDQSSSPPCSPSPTPQTRPYVPKSPRPCR